ncbi:MAG: hypothetical protein OXF54_03250 [Caldilineaceae bacterium]|nr:hypothetical protein [Caldilineaceae bacterium]
MDAKRFLVLKTDVEVQLAVIDEVCAKIEDRARGFKSDDARPIQVESVAFQIHNSYSAVRALLRVLAAHFEYQIGDATHWKSALLLRMTQPIPGVRPAPLTKETFALLDALRGFRYFFRHAYATTIDPVLLESNLQLSRQAHSLLHRDISDFLDQLRPEE